MGQVKRTPGPAKKELAQLIKLFDGHVLKVGVLDGAKEHRAVDLREADGASKTAAPITMGEIAAIHEFGIGVPERSFLRGYFKESNATVAEAALRLLRSRGATPAMLETLGTWLVGQIQLRIANRIPPPLAASTIARKGSDVPLIDTGQLRSSIAYKVEKA